MARTLSRKKGWLHLDVYLVSAIPGQSMVDDVDIAVGYDVIVIIEGLCLWFTRYDSRLSLVS